jgi:hypothetical protein
VDAAAGVAFTRDKADPVLSDACLDECPLQLDSTRLRRGPRRECRQSADVHAIQGPTAGTGPTSDASASLDTLDHLMHPTNRCGKGSMPQQ